MIVGAGQAGAQLAVSLRDAGYDRAVTLVGDEPGLPYQRPPLSKAYLLGKLGEDGLNLRAGPFFEKQSIGIEAGHRVIAIDRGGNRVGLEDGRWLGYEHLVLATGTRNRPLPVPGAGLANVLSLRSLHDARLLRSALEGKREAVVIGAGFIGMEFAAVASARGLQVTVVEAAARVMARSSSPEISAWFQRRHEARGVQFRSGDGVVGIEGEDGAAAAVVLADGTRLPAGLVLVAVGVVPNAELASAAGLRVENGIVVDGHLQTSDPAISAIGDCAAAPSVHRPGLLRLESVQNAVDQAKTLAPRLTGKPVPYGAVPWFWSDQGADKLQIAGLVDGCPQRVTVGDMDLAKFSVLSFDAGRIAGAESVNRPTDHMAARRLINGGAALTYDQAAKAGFDLVAFVSASRAAA